MNIQAQKLNHSHIANLATVDHDVVVDGDVQPGNTTGQIASITKARDVIYINLGGISVPVKPEDQIFIHSSHLQMHSADIIDIAHQVGDEFNANNQDA